LPLLLNVLIEIFRNIVTREETHFKLSLHTFNVEQQCQLVYR